FARGSHQHLVAFALQAQAQHALNGLVVVDHQHAEDAHAASLREAGALGSFSAKVLPASLDCSSRSSPPKLCAIEKLIESPSPKPLPGSLVEKKGSKTRERTDSGTPGPLSRTRRTTCAASS